MRIGFVYDLRDEYLAAGMPEEHAVEFDTAETVGLIADAIVRDGHEVVRVGNGRALAKVLVQGTRFDLVVSIAEGLRGRNREAHVPAVCELFDQPYAFSDPLTLAATLDKAVAKRLARDAGVPTAPFVVLEAPEEAARVDLGWPVFVKPIAEGTGKGCGPDSKVSDAAALEVGARKLILKFRQPVLVEPFLPGREFTVGFVGTGAAAEIIGIMEVHFLARSEVQAYGFQNKSDWEGRISYSMPTDKIARRAGEVALAAYRALECRDLGRVDLRCNEREEPLLLELNPLPGLKPDYGDYPILAKNAGLAYDTLIHRILKSAAARWR
jgi:D-alanine-D-alanine ligase